MNKQHYDRPRPENRRKDSSDKARHRLKNVAAKATSEQRKSRLMRPVCRGFCFFCRAKEGNRNYCLKWLQPKIKGKIDWILKINHVIYVTIKQYWCKVDSGIYRQFLLSVFMQTLRSFCADRKNQRALRMDAFYTANEADGFRDCGTRSTVCGVIHLARLNSNSPRLFPQTIDAVCLKA